MTSVFRKILDQSPEMVFLVEKNPPYRVVFENRSFREALGMDLRRKSLSDFGLDRSNLSTGDQVTIKYHNAYYSFIVGEEDSNYFIFQNGSLVELDTMESSKGNASTSTKEKCSSFYKNLIDKIPNTLFQMNMTEEGKMNFKYFSDGGMNILNESPSSNGEVKGIDYLLGMVFSQDVGKVLQSLVHSTRLLSMWNCTFRLKLEGKDELVWVQGMARPEEGPTGDMNWYGCLLDISGFKERELELENHKNLALNASKVKSDFISMITHDIRTPLNTISGSVFSLLGEDHYSSQEPLLNTISFAVDNLIIMINDLLDFQKIEAGKIVLESKPFNLKQLMEQVVNSLRFQALESKNDLNLIISDKVDFTVLGDKVRLSQILNNLITNALKFTHEGRVDVTVTMIDHSYNSAKVYFEVKDNGVGIDKKDFGKVFNEFDQVNESFDAKYGGTGLGMPITKRLLENMGSEINLASEVGIGSTFSFEINFEKFGTSKQHLSFELDELPRSGNTFLNNKAFRQNIQVLLAEDNQVNAMVVMKILKGWGYACDRVSNGEEAIASVFDKTYDIILMDIQMPVIDGLEASKIIKERFDIPIIALTAASRREVAEGLKQSNIDDFVSKPINAIVLQKSIENLIQHYIS
ncbi:response regulator [Echinicola marina]|uniref:ATP-binding protein n=1 Tax=Echinicola marina TaxID=2859768 RepID=UPI001CF667BA|nr:ATP-binding protein [Echinicola marina]UCS91612.1 response regulator [Echinicola marina]